MILNTNAVAIRTSEESSMEKSFVYEDKQVRTVEINGEVWFVAKDVCDILEHSNHRMAIQDLDEDEKGVSEIYTPGGMQSMTIISEAGLYTLLMRSNKPEAKPFRRWVTHEVLPAICRDGVYLSPKAEEEMSRLKDNYRRLQDENRMLSNLLDPFIEPPYQIGGLPDAPSPAKRLFAKSPFITMENLARVLTASSPFHHPVTASNLLVWLRQAGYLSMEADSWNQPTKTSLECNLFVVHPSSKKKPQPVCTSAGLEHLLHLQKDAQETFVPQTDEEILRMVKKATDLRQMII